MLLLLPARKPFVHQLSKRLHLVVAIRQWRRTSYMLPQASSKSNCPLLLKVSPLLVAHLGPSLPSHPTPALTPSPVSQPPHFLSAASGVQQVQLLPFCAPKNPARTNFAGLLLPPCPSPPPPTPFPKFRCTHAHRPSWQGRCFSAFPPPSPPSTCLAACSSCKARM